MSSTYKDDSNFSTIGFRSPDFLVPSVSGGMSSADSAITTDSIFRSATNHGFDKFQTGSTSRPNGPGDSVGSKLIRNLSLMQPDSNYTVSKSLWGTNLNGDLNHTQNDKEEEDRGGGGGGGGGSLTLGGNGRGCERDRMLELKTPPRSGRKRSADASPIGLLAALCEERNISSTHLSSLSPIRSPIHPSFRVNTRSDNTQDSRQQNSRPDLKLDSRQERWLESSASEPTQSTSDAAIFLSNLDYREENDSHHKDEEGDQEEEEEEELTQGHEESQSAIRRNNAELSMQFELEKEDERERKQNSDSSSIRGSGSFESTYVRTDVGASTYSLSEGKSASSNSITDNNYKIDNINSDNVYKSNKYNNNNNHNIDILRDGGVKKEESSGGVARASNINTTSTLTSSHSKIAIANLLNNENKSDHDMHDNYYKSDISNADEFENENVNVNVNEIETNLERKSNPR